jgi:hypothetical protein
MGQLIKASSLQHHSPDFKRRLKSLCGKIGGAPLSTTKDMQHPSENMSREEHARLVDSITFHTNCHEETS